MTHTQIIGIDCATDPKHMGLARGVTKTDTVELLSAAAGTTHANNIELVAGWIRESDRSLICIDAPLGWPTDLGDSLAKHTAGAPLSVPPNQLFRRHTDREVKRLLGKQPLDVGADRIARTAHAALTFLEDLREATGLELSLVWEPAFEATAGSIETYPAATLVTHGFQSTGYKTNKDTEAREGILADLGNVMVLPQDTEAMLASADALDAALCVLAGQEFLRGLCVAPADVELARKEGWIWVRRGIAKEDWDCRQQFTGQDLVFRP